MPIDSSEASSRKPRADALRNRERILHVAREAFTKNGANVSLDDVAKQAGVGPGTLYRHFPTREALLEAVYRTEVEKLAAAEKEFATTMPPVEALREWMRLFVDYMATKQIIVPALNTIVGCSPKSLENTGDLIRSAIDGLVKRAVESGEIRGDLDPLDLLRALAGVSNIAAGPNWPESAKRLVDILILGSRPVA
ncbi:MAG TPA: TetR/AcrR family transcriptional regulator [Edaphobacter sp.]|jgi:AcrR family transcriptional regulator